MVFLKNPNASINAVIIIFRVVEQNLNESAPASLSIYRF